MRGTLVTGLTEGDVFRLDVFEGDEYERRKVRVWPLAESGRDEKGSKGNVRSKLGSAELQVGGEDVEAETYVWVAGEELLEGEEWDFESFMREKMGGWIGVQRPDYVGE